jgi:hypothetical protein
VTDSGTSALRSARPANRVGGGFIVVAPARAPAVDSSPAGVGVDFYRARARAGSRRAVMSEMCHQAPASLTRFAGEGGQLEVRASSVFVLRRQLRPH